MIFAIFDLKRPLKLLDTVCHQFLKCLILSLRLACFPFKTSRQAQWVHLFSMDFDNFSTIYLFLKSKGPFSMIKLSFSGYTIYLPLLSIEASDAIRPGLIRFISMIISVKSRCGFKPIPYTSGLYLQPQGLSLKGRPQCHYGSW